MQEVSKSITIQSNKIKAIPYGAIKEPGEDKRKIPPGMFKPHMTFMISGKTGSGKSTALIRMLKAYCDSGVFQKVVLISPTAAYDAKYKMLPNGNAITDGPRSANHRRPPNAVDR